MVALSVLFLSSSLSRVLHCHATCKCPIVAEWCQKMRVVGSVVDIRATQTFTKQSQHIRNTPRTLLQHFRNTPHTFATFLQHPKSLFFDLSSNLLRNSTQHSNVSAFLFFCRAVRSAPCGSGPRRILSAKRKLLAKFVRWRPLPTLSSPCRPSHT